jgi:DNA-binding PadR family transcriptional regulator
MKLDKTILARLERNGFITRTKEGRTSYVSLTESGNYAAHISGMLT